MNVKGTDKTQKGTPRFYRLKHALENLFALCSVGLFVFWAPGFWRFTDPTYLKPPCFSYEASGLLWPLYLWAALCLGASALSLQTILEDYVPEPKRHQAITWVFRVMLLGIAGLAVRAVGPML